jgi:hypothetical protein
MNGELGDGASAGDHDKYGAQGRRDPQGDRSSRRRGSGIVPDPGPPKEPGHYPRLFRPSRVRLLNHVLPVRRRIRACAGAEVEPSLPQSRRERSRRSDAG